MIIKIQERAFSGIYRELTELTATFAISLHLWPVRAILAQRNTLQPFIAPNNSTKTMFGFQITIKKRPNLSQECPKSPQFSFLIPTSEISLVFTPYVFPESLGARIKTL